MEGKNCSESSIQKKKGKKQRFGRDCTSLPTMRNPKTNNEAQALLLASMAQNHLHEMY